MATSGEVTLTIADGGATITLPAVGVQVVMGCSSAGSSGTVLATNNANTLTSTCGVGPLCEAAALTIAAGGTVLAMKLPTVTAGAVVSGAAKTITGATNADPIVITATAHGMTSGEVATIAAVGGNTAANGTWKITKIDADTFSIPVAGSGVYTSGGTATWTGAIQSGTGTSANYFDGAAVDEMYPIVTWTKGGTVGTDSLQCTISLDAGRTTRLATITIGTATSYAIPGRGITLHLQSGKTIVAGDTVRAHTTPPLPDISGITAAIDALVASPYGNAGWGSMHVAAPISGADAATLGAKLDSIATTKLIYTRCIAHARDATPPTAWGGSGETDSAWGTSLLSDFASVSAKRLAVDAGYYNMRSAYPTTTSGTPIYRRPLSWAHAARIIALPTPADLESWRRLGALSQIIEDAVADQLDGFVYHDEQAGAVFDSTLGGAGRMGSARHVKKRTGWYMSRPITLAPTGSDFLFLADGRVIDEASNIVQEVLGPDIDERIKLNRNGTVLERDAALVEADVARQIDSQIGNQISGRTIVVDRTWNVRDTDKIKITGTIVRDGRVLEIDFTLGYGS